MEDPALNPYAPPAAAEEAPPPPKPITSLSDMTLGARIAGGLLVANGLLNVLEWIVMSGKGGKGPSILPVVLDFVIGASLLGNNPKFRAWAVLRAALGAVIFAGIQAASGEYFLCVLQLAVSSSFLMLLLGDAGKVRIGASCTIFGIYTLLEIVGLISITSGAG